MTDPRPRKWDFPVRASSKYLEGDLTQAQVEAIINGSLEDELCERCGLSVAVECKCECECEQLEGAQE